MENAVDALKMAAAVMIFVLALSVSINAFSEARIASTTLLDYADREFLLGKSDYYNSDTFGKNRIVGVETIIPAIYKAYSDESYKLVFINNNDEPIELYKLNDETINTMGLVYDVSKGIGVSPSNRKNFIEMILYGKNRYREDDTTLASLQDKIDFTNEGLYGKINNNSFEESSGVYYQGEENGKSNSPEVNKQKIRVITYKATSLINN